ncbi:unnamed protein product, partial [Vitis vinifera]
MESGWSIVGPSNDKEPEEEEVVATSVTAEREVCSGTTGWCVATRNFFLMKRMQSVNAMLRS